MMKFVRFLIVLVVAGVVGAAAWYMSQIKTSEAIYPGYVEGEYIDFSVPAGGTLETLDVSRGDRVAAGTRLFALNTEAAEADVAQAEANVHRAEAELADLRRGERAEELEVRLAEIKEAQAALLNAEQELARQQELVGSTAFVQAKLDAAQAARDQAKARLTALKQAFDVANLPARQDRLEAAAQAVKEGEAALAKAARRLTELKPTAPVEAVVEDTFFLPGAWVPAGRPVLSLLPDDKRKLRFFVPEADVAKMQVGKSVRFMCDGCAANLSARITYVAPKAEYTPPVIYSAASREKLVFMIEALPEGGTILPVGLPIEVEREE
ncbi:HlyD family secretion protein [Kordiimonas gwangyangensis]|uniref:HlyD family secretion protein n=1 Tax=Kordiimonas gwangyangensis TaxID=288022 RepID=UPI000472DBEC|nr:HlyD family efflux transporter periplasmic adaptor subunit [Kordiimonas gwangyangensis]